jgi:hypothetical protein
MVADPILGFTNYARKMISYELHTLRKHVSTKEWAIDAVFEDRALALHEAAIMDNSNRYAGIRVIAEDHNTASGNTKATTIFRGGLNFKEAKAKVVEGTAVAGRRLPPEPRKTVRRPSVAAAGDKRSVMLLVPMLLLCLLIGIGSMYALYALVPD